MPDYQNYKCPVCKKKFAKDDDIVTCPECGTPHHRECYNLAGHCVNEGLHKSGYSFLDEEDKELQNADKNDNYITQQNNDDYYYTPDEDIIESAKQAYEENSQKQEKTSNQDNNTSTKGFSPFSTIQFDTNQYREKGEIDGVSINDISATIRSNIPRFITIFKNQSKNKKKIGWNWSAFFFGSFYLLFRKMYKQGIAFLALVAAAVISGEAMIFKFAPEYISSMQDFVSKYTSNPTNVSPDDIQSVMAASDFSNAQLIVYIILGVILVLRIIQAMFADSYYKSTVFNIIKNVTEQLDSGANFTQTTIFFGQTQQLDQEQMKRLYLGNKGGVSLFAPFTAYFVIYIIFTFI